MTYYVTLFSRYPYTFVRDTIFTFCARCTRLISTNFPNIILQHLFLTPLAYNDHWISRLASNLASRWRYEEREGVCSSLPREKVKAKAVCFEDEMRHGDLIVPAFDRPGNHSPSQRFSSAASLRWSFLLKTNRCTCILPSNPNFTLLMRFSLTIELKISIS